MVTEKTLNQFKRILIIRLSSLGDILLTTPLVRSLKNKYPELKIDFLLKPQYEDIYKHNPRLDSLFHYKKDTLKETIHSLKNKNYDLVIDLQNNLRSRAIVKKLNVPAYRFRKKSLEKFLLVHFKINRLKNEPGIPVRYSQTLPDFNLDDDGLELFLPDHMKSELTPGINYLGFCPGSRHYTKKWLFEYYTELGKKLTVNGYTIVLFGGKDDLEICGRISQLIPGAINLCNADELLKTAVNMRQCKLIVCNDSGLMHTACAVNLPVIMIMGSTVKEFGFTPYKNKNLILENNSLSCRPCSHIGRDKCPEKHFKCMKELTPELVYSEVTNFIKTI